MNYHIMSSSADLADSIASAVESTQKPVLIYRIENGLHYPVIDDHQDISFQKKRDANNIYAMLPAVFPEWLGDRSFNETYGARYAYVVGEMARGIASTTMVIEAVRAGFVGFLGSAGLRVPTIASALAEIRQAVGPQCRNWGANLIHSPDHAGIERASVDLFLDQGVPCVSASAFMRLSPDIVRYAVAGLSRDDQGQVRRGTHVFAKISRPEVAKPFMMPAPADLLRELVAAGRVTAEQADLATLVPVAEDVTVEGDSGGHTDSRPIVSLFPVLARLRDALGAQHRYAQPIRLGFAGGLGTPSAVAGAFQQGAAYVVTGSINQSAVEAGTSLEARKMLAQADVADVIMAPASDMFELGVKVQVLKRGSMFAVRGQRLYDIYRRYESFDAIPLKDRGWLESQVLREPFEAAWSKCRDYLEKANPALLAQAGRDPKVRMAQVFRSYLFFGAQWARDGAPDRRADYQIWCGPAMGAFNDAVRGTVLEAVENRTVAAMGRYMLEGAARITRAHHLRAAGVHVPAELFTSLPDPVK